MPTFFLNIFLSHMHTHLRRQRRRRQWPNTQACQTRLGSSSLSMIEVSQGVSLRGDSLLRLRRGFAAVLPERVAASKKRFLLRKNELVPSLSMRIVRGTRGCTQGPAVCAKRLNNSLLFQPSNLQNKMGEIPHNFQKHCAHPSHRLDCPLAQPKHLHPTP